MKDSIQKIFSNVVVTPEDIAIVIASWTSVPVTKVTKTEAANLLQIKDEMNDKVVGQPETINAICSAMRRARACIRSPRRPICLMFAGPTGYQTTFQRRLDSNVAKLTASLTNYEEGTPAYLALQDQIDRTKLRFDKYQKQGLLCGAEGLSYLIADGRASHAGECCTPSSSLGVFSAIIVCRALSKKNFKKVGKTSLKV